MSRTKIALISGAAIGLTAFSANAQNPNTDAERAYGAELLAEADARTSLLQVGGSAGYTEGDGFGINSGDGNWSLNIDAHTEFSYTINTGADNTNASGDTADLGTGFGNWGFIAFHGNAVNQDTSYRIQIEIREDGFLQLNDAWLAYEMENGVTVAAGQFFVPLFHQEYRVAEDKQLGTNSSIGTQALGAMRSQGVMARWSDEQFEVIGAFTDGYRGANTPTYTEASDYSVTLRANWFGAGSADDFKQASSFRGSENAWFVGGAFHYETGGENAGSVDNDLTAFGIDGQFREDGWQAGGGVYFISVEPSGGTDADLFVVNVEGSVFVDDSWEVFGRYDLIDLDNSALAEDSFSFFTIGANHFFVPNSYAARFIGEIIFATTEIPAAAGIASSNNGLLASTEDSQVVIKGQLNWSF